MKFFLEAALLLGLAIVVAGVLLSLLAIEQDLDDGEPQPDAAAGRHADPVASMKEAIEPAQRQTPASSSARACAAAKSRSPE